MKKRWAVVPSVVIALCAITAVQPITSAFALSAATGAFTGAVTAADTGGPLAGVTLKILDLKTAETLAELLTTEEGIAELGEIPFGLYQVSVTAPEGYVSAAGPLIYLDEDNATASVNFALEPMPTAPGSTAAIAGRTWLLIILLILGAIAIEEFIRHTGGSTSE